MGWKILKKKFTKIPTQDRTWPKDSVETSAILKPKNEQDFYQILLKLLKMMICFVRFFNQSLMGNFGRTTLFIK